MKICPIQYSCSGYGPVGREPPNNDIRDKYPCKGWLKIDCEMGLRLYKHYTGKYPACKVNKDRKIKESCFDPMSEARLERADLETRRIK